MVEADFELQEWSAHWGILLALGVLLGLAVATTVSKMVRRETLVTSTVLTVITGVACTQPDAGTSATTIVIVRSNDCDFIPQVPILLLVVLILAASLFVSARQESRSTHPTTGLPAATRSHRRNGPDECTRLPAWRCFGKSLLTSSVI